MIENIKTGALYDFGDYGRLYVISQSGDTLFVTDERKDRKNPDASGWNIRASYARKRVRPS
jgi:hypothetical protein